MRNFLLLTLSLFLVFGCTQPGADDNYDPSSDESVTDISTVYGNATPPFDGPSAVYYDYWLAKYVKKSRYYDTNAALYVAAGANGAVESDWIAAEVEAKSQSEAHGYGMLISAIAGDKPVFDGLYNMFKLYPSSTNPNLMSWIIPETEDSSLSKSSSATDGDFDIAYALILAHEKWTSSGPINYLQEARTMINNGIKISLISPTSYKIKMGDWNPEVKSGTSNYDKHSTRASDWMPGHLRVFNAYNNVSDDAYWNTAIDTVYSLIDAVADSNTGLVPDFVVNDPPVVAPEDYLEGPTDDDYSWNACRYPWRITTDYVHNSEARAKTAVSKLLDWWNGDNPADFWPGYTLGGIPLVQTYTSAAFSSPIAAAAMVDTTTYASLLANGKTYMNNQKYSYYGDTINMLCMMLVNGDWAAPDGTP